MSEESKIPAEQASEPAKNKPTPARRGTVAPSQRSSRTAKTNVTVWVENPSGGVNRILESEAIKLVKRKKGFRIVDAPKKDK